jgi:predicted nucleic acid-binding protein
MPSSVQILFLDTNPILRYLTKDNPDQSARAKVIFDQVEEGTLLVTTSETIIGEVVFVLSSKVLYNLPRDEIRTHLRNVLSLRGLRLAHKRMYLRALDLYAALPKLDFADALSIADMERRKLTTIFSFDRDFDGIHGITRREP